MKQLFSILLVVAVVVVAAIAEAQQPKKVSSDRVSIVAAPAPDSDRPRQFGSLCASLVT